MQFRRKPVYSQNISRNEDWRIRWSKVNSLFKSWWVTPECQALFHGAEKYFRIETNITSIHRINTEQITKSLMNYKDVISTTNSIVEICS